MVNEDILDQSIVKRINDIQQKIVSSTSNSMCLDMSHVRQQAQDKVFSGSHSKEEFDK